MARKAICVLLITAAWSCAHEGTSAAEPTGDIAAMERIEALQRDAVNLYPNGRIRATVKSVGFIGTRGTREAGTSSPSGTKELRGPMPDVVENWVYRGVPQSERWAVTDVNVGTEHLHFDGLRRNVHVYDWKMDQGIDCVACIPRHCWFGGNEACSRRWTWLTQYPAGTTIIDQRARPPRTFLVESGEPLDPAP